MPSARWFTEESAWSGAEKKVARRAFDQAYHRKCADIEARMKKMAVRASSPSDMWEIHDYLSEQRRIVDDTFDYRYSVLLSVLGYLLREGWLSKADLVGLRDDKIEKIKRWASL
jgi:photoprotection regulator FRP-like protein